MKVENINYTNFKAKYQTSKILGITSRKVLDTDGMEGYIETIKSIIGRENIPKYIGSKGYNGYAAKIAEKILPKYPKIAEATEKIQNILKENPLIFQKDLLKKVEPILRDFGAEVDIVI